MKTANRHCKRCKRTLAPTTILRMKKNPANVTGLCGLCVALHRQRGWDVKRIESRAGNGIALTGKKMALNLVERLTREERARYAAT